MKPVFSLIFIKTFLSPNFSSIRTRDGNNMTKSLRKSFDVNIEDYLEFSVQ